MVCRLPRLLDAERWVQLISRSGISDRVTYLLPPGVKVFREDGTVSLGGHADGGIRGSEADA